MAPEKTLAGIVLAALVLPCCSSFSIAGNAGGTSAFQFLGLGVGARPAAMGEAFAGAADDVSAIYWNPAGLAGVEREELTMSHALWLEGITYSNIALGQPALGGTIGAAFNTLNTGDIQKADNTGLRLAGNYSMADTMGVISYARANMGLAMGASLKYISSRLEKEAAHAYAIDIGAQYGGFLVGDKLLSLGLAVQNVGTKAKYVSEAYPLPVIVRAGGSLKLFKDLLSALDLTYEENVLNVCAGAEYGRAVGAFRLAARAGYKSGTVKELGFLSGLTAGMGIKWNDYQFDYAWNSFTDLGITHRFSLGMKLGGKDNKGGQFDDRIISIITLN